MKRDDLQAAIRLLEAAGWAIVPRSPTPEMLREGWYGAIVEDAEAVWSVMLTAAPLGAEIQALSVEFCRPTHTPENDS